MNLFQYKEIGLKMLADEDALLLVKWLSDPAVLAYYEGRDRPHDLALVRENFYSKDRHVTPCLIQYNGLSIGYLQFYELDKEDQAAYGYSNPSEIIFGMDQFIGETEYWGRGIGTKLIQSMIKYLTEQRIASKIVMDPQTWNERALHVYEKCGFVKKQLLKEHELHEGKYRDCWLIEYTHNKE